MNEFGHIVTPCAFYCSDEIFHCRRLVELLTREWNLSIKLRVPAVSRLQVSRYTTCMGMMFNLLLAKCASIGSTSFFPLLLEVNNPPPSFMCGYNYFEL